MRLIDAIKKYFRFKRLVKEFKRSHYQAYTIHQNMKGEEWVTIEWKPLGV